MSLKVFSSGYLDGLSGEAMRSHRRRQHRNIHKEYGDGCQRLFNAIEPDSYIRPHRHGMVPRRETMIAVRGLIVLCTFDDEGVVGCRLILWRGRLSESFPVLVTFKISICCVSDGRSVFHG